LLIWRVLFVFEVTIERLTPPLAYVADYRYYFDVAAPWVGLKNRDNDA